MYIMTVKGCKELDKLAAEKLKYPSLILMENAATSICEKVKDTGEDFLVICGTGNNGGDGLAIGRKLLVQGKKVFFVVISPKDKVSNDFKVNFEIIKSLTNNIKVIKSLTDIDNFKYLLNKYEIIIDSIFGVGINRSLDKFYSAIIDSINESNKYIVSVDTPSGLDGDTGVPLGNAVKATVTYSFEVIKRGFINYSAFQYLGRTEVVSIGIPESIKEFKSEGVKILHKDYYQNIIKKRKVYGHKGDYGRAIILAGSPGLTGAAYISTEACVRTGTGLTTLVTAPESQDLLSSMLIEAMTSNYNDEAKVKSLLKSSNAIAFGPGVKSERASEDLLLSVINNSIANIVIDAEGINILSRRSDILEKIKGRAILTPHLGEMARLVNMSIKEIEENRIEVAKEYASRHSCVLLLKGYNTVITDGNNVFINDTGSSKMASGGMGDCLTGIITSLIAQGNSLVEAALLGTYIHGLSGQRCIDKYSVVARDVVRNIPFVMNELIK